MYVLPGRDDMQLEDTYYSVGGNRFLRVDYGEGRRLCTHNIPITLLCIPEDSND